MLSKAQRNNGRQWILIHLSIKRFLVNHFGFRKRSLTFHTLLQIHSYETDDSVGESQKKKKVKHWTELTLKIFHV